jgi:spermidine synthase
VVQILFSGSLLISAALLFWVQLFTSKMVLPVLGGGAAVWNTCLVFFQVALLLGYLYAHATDRWLPSRLKGFLHPVLLLIAGLVLPVSLKGIAMPSGDTQPVLWLLKTLSLVVGAPFLILAGTAPLLQSWYSRTQGRSSRDPYFLYAASNLGSLAALASYPTLIEPHLHLTYQSTSWTVGYFLLAGLTVLCAIMTYIQDKGDRVSEVTASPSQPVNALTRLRWILLAFVPSSLLLGVTTHLTMDVAAAPLFWVIPLILYLLSFVLAFQRLVPISRRLVAWLQAVLLVALACVFLSGPGEKIIHLFALHLAAFFVTALLCHQELSRLRPAVKNLTEFYLLIALGGALGGIFNALVAPLLFNDIIEYPLMLIVACLLRPGHLPRINRPWAALGDFFYPLVLFLILMILDYYCHIKIADLNDKDLLIIVVIPALAVFSFQRRPVRMGLGLAVLIVIGLMMSDSDNTLIRTRNFYGVLKVTAENQPPMHMLYNGTTLHGSQSEDPMHHLDPLTYYHSKGPLGQMFTAVNGTSLTQHVGLVGLGTGTIACYEKPGEHWTFFEINPADVAIAQNSKYFTFLRDCPAHPEIVLGDARLSMSRQPDGSFDMIILDAFSSDSIPIHLITREAVQLYLSKLRPNGIIVLHISNRFLNLAPVIANIADSLNLTARYWRDDDDGDDNNSKTFGKTASDWVLVVHRDVDLKRIKNDPRWKPLLPLYHKSVWTDDYSNLFGALIR